MNENITHQDKTPAANFVQRIEVNARDFASKLEELARDADNRQVIVKDSSGKQIASLPLTAGAVAGFSAETARGFSVALELLLLPLRHRGRTHARLLGALSPAFSPDWLGLDQITSVRLVSVRMISASGRHLDAAEEFAVTPEKRRANFVLHEGGRL